jgi:hypothetical protein
VYITGRREEVLKTTADKYGDNGKIITYVGALTLCINLAHAVTSLTADLTSRDDVLRIAKEVQQKEPGGIHVLVRIIIAED